MRPAKGAEFVITGGPCTLGEQTFNPMTDNTGTVIERRGEVVTLSVAGGLLFSAFELLGKSRVERGE